MLSRLTLGFFALSAAIGIAACSSFGSATVGGNGVGPNFPSQTLYASNSNQNAVSIFNPGQKSGTGPSYQIGGASTTLNGPQYLTFDRSQNLWVTNYNASTNKATLVEIAALATGNVIPLLSTAITGRPRGVAITPKSPTPSPAAEIPFATAKPSTSPSPSPTPNFKAALMVVSDVIPTNVYPSQLLLFIEGTTTPYQSIAGPNPNLNVPGGLAIDKEDNIYVANIQGASVDKFVLPTPSPTPKPTPTTSPTPTPKPTPSPSTSPSVTPSPTPSPTPTPFNIRPTFQIAGAKTHVITPTSVAVDVNGNVYISDQGASHAGCGSARGPAILIYARPHVRGLISTPPTRTIAGCTTKLKAPTDVKVDKNGLIYVADTSETGGGIVWIYAATAAGNAAPMGYYTSPGAVTGIGVVP
ncbi:MAG: hypothetical protein JO029_14070 [Candidatus Eremiobacteraeota bacterium]|nr:hypothetical protein [Candidatus Eremiobacteraeota bacterium]